MAADESAIDELAAGAAEIVLPGVGGLLGSRLSKTLRAEWARNSSSALRAAEVSSGLSREDFAEWIERDPRAVPLYLKVLWAAGMNGHDETLRAMGAVLGEAAKATVSGSDDALRRAELALRAMADLGPLHFQMLGVLHESVVIPSETGGDNLSQFTTAYVSEQTGLDKGLVAQCLLNLANCGLTVLTSVFGDNAFPLTDLGRAVLRAAHHVG